MPPFPTSGDFSLVLGGPLYQIYLRTRIARPSLELLHRRLLAFPLVAWLPLLVLSALAGHATGDRIAVPFLHDAEAHARFLVALPLLLLAEPLVHWRLGPLVRQFLDRDLVPPEARPRFVAAVDSAMRLRNSLPAELILLALAWGLHPIWLRQITLEAPTWYAAPGPQGPELRPAGLFYAFVSLPFFRFLWFRWLFRLGVWARFLWQVSNIPLRLNPVHPDRVAGLGFLGESAYAFAPILAAHGALLAGLLANRIFFAGAKLVDFKLEILALIAFLLCLVLGPLCVFMRQLARARRVGLRSYGKVASSLGDRFERKWIEGQTLAAEERVDAGDIRSINEAYRAIEATRFVPFTRDIVFRLAVATALPGAPLVLTMIPFRELIDRLLGVLL